MYEHDSAGGETARLEDYLPAGEIVVLGVFAAITCGAKEIETLAGNTEALVGPNLIGSAQQCGSALFGSLHALQLPGQTGSARRSCRYAV